MVKSQILLDVKEKRGLLTILKGELLKILDDILKKVRAGLHRAAVARGVDEILLLKER